MSDLVNNINCGGNADFDFLDEEEVVLEQSFRSYKELSQNKKDFWLDDYTYYSNDDDDDTIPDFIVDVLQVSKIYNKETSNVGKSIEQKIDKNNNVRDKKNITNKNVKDLMQRSGWKIVGTPNCLTTSANVNLYISYQIYNEKHYIVLSKAIRDRKPKNFAMPVSVAEFVANRIVEAFNKKDKIVNLDEIKRKEWVLCKQYGTIYPHPQNYITISHQRHKNKDYIVLAKYDWRKNPRTFVFNIDFSGYIRDMLLREYIRGKRNGENIYKFSFS